MGGATTQASNFTSHTPQPQYSSSSETGGGGNPLGGPGYDYFGSKAPPTSQPSPSQSSSYGGGKDQSIKTENTADNGDDNQLHGGIGGVDDVKVKEEYDGGVGGGGEAGERSVRSTDSLNSPVKSEKLEGTELDKCINIECVKYYSNRD